jgi:hypothetical protein
MNILFSKSKPNDVGSDQNLFDPFIVQFGGIFFISIKQSVGWNRVLSRSSIFQSI